MIFKRGRGESRLNRRRSTCNFFVISRVSLVWGERWPWERKGRRPAERRFRRSRESLSLSLFRVSEGRGPRCIRWLVRVTEWPAHAIQPAFIWTDRTLTVWDDDFPQLRSRKRMTLNVYYLVFRGMWFMALDQLNSGVTRHSRWTWIPWTASKLLGVIGFSSKKFTRAILDCRWKFRVSPMTNCLIFDKCFQYYSFTRKELQ